MDLTIWDMMGQAGFPELLKDALFHRTKGILAVCSVSRWQSLTELEAWIRSAFQTVGEIPVVFAVNDAGAGPVEITEADIRSLAQRCDALFYFTWTATGENVEKAFQTLAERIVARDLQT